MAISDQLRQAIRDCGLSLNQIAKGAGVDQPMLSRFMSSDGQANDIRLQRNADKLADYFGLELTPMANKPAAKPKRGRLKSAAPSRRPTEKKIRRSSTTGAKRRGRGGGGLVKKVSSEEMDEQIDRVQRQRGRPTIARGTHPDE
jgi:hypothetical protein